MTLLLLYFITGYVAALVQIARDKDGYWEGRPRELLFLIAQEMVLWGPMALALLVVDVLSRRQARMEVKR